MCIRILLGIISLLCNATVIEAQKAVIKKDIPVSVQGKTYSYYRDKPLVEKKLGLKSLESGFDSIQVRIWYTYSFKDSSQLFILKKTAEGWYAETLLFKYITDGGSEGGYSINVLSKKEQVPGAGWNFFTDRLFKLDVTSLPDMYSIKSYPDMTDGDMVVVEVAQKYSYRIYTYKLPFFVRKVVKEAKQMSRIINLIRVQFGWKPLSLL